LRIRSLEVAPTAAARRLDRAHPVHDLVAGRRPSARMSTLAPTLVLGGARSGKSAFAEKLVCDSGRPRIYVATAAAGDAEMKSRIEHHRTRRGANWRTIEEPLALADTIVREATGDGAVLVDCLTLWLSNLMHAQGDVERETSALIAAIRRSSAPLVLVS